MLSISWRVCDALLVVQCILVGAVAGNACASLQHLLGDKVSFPDDDIYAMQQNGSGTAGYWSMQEAELQPACRVTPARTDDVAVAVRALVSMDCRFAVRSGGHASWAGAANVGPEGVTIDLSDLNQIVLGSDGTVASVGPGARWGDVYLELEHHGVAVSGGRVSSVGVSGLTLGGGKSFFTAQVGFVCDNVVAFEIVTASGEILEVRETYHADLFKALKGGAGNFGVVTRIDFRTFKQGKLWGGSVVYPESTIDKQLQTLFDFTEASAMSTEVAESEVIFAYVLAQDKTLISNFYTHTAPRVNPEIFHDFTSIEPQISSTMRISNLSDFATELEKASPNGARYLFASATFANDLGLMKDIIQLINETYTPLNTDEDPKVFLSSVLQPLTKPMLAHGCGKNSLGLCSEEGNLMILDLTSSWTNAANDYKIETAAKRILDGVAEKAKARGKDSPYIYLNYAAEWQAPIASYGKENVEHLQAVSCLYDPSQAFQRLVGGQKLPEGYQC